MRQKTSGSADSPTRSPGGRQRLPSSQGPGTAMLFALAIVARLCGPDVAAKIRAPMMLP
jgi:hypothetical protein